MARHRVQVLRAAGKTLKQVAAETGVSQRSVRRIELERPLETVADVVQAAERGVGRPSVVEAWRERVAAVLVAEPTLPTVEILHRLREERYAGGKTALYELVRELRPKPTSPQVRFEGVAGEFSQHDFGRSVRKARFPFLRTIEDFDFTFQTLVRLQLLGSYLGPELVTEGRSLVLCGPSGTGKTHLAIAVAYRAIQNGYEALFTSAAGMIEDLSTATRRGELARALAYYTHPHPCW